VAQSNIRDEQSKAPASARKVRSSGYLAAICAALALGSVAGLLAAAVVQNGPTRDAGTSLVSAVEAAPALGTIGRAITQDRSGRAAPRLLYPESAEALGADNPFLRERPVRGPEQQGVASFEPTFDQLDLPLADGVTLLATVEETATPAEPLTPIIEAISAVEPQQRPRIAIVLDDLGLDEKATRRAIALPSGVTLSFLPYGRASVGLAEEGLARGHEIMVHIPMEPEGTMDPGPNALTVDLSADQISSRLARQLDMFPGAVGFNNHMGSRFTADVRALLPVMREARARGLLFLDSRTTANTFAAKVAEAAGATTLSRDVFLDYVSGADGLLAQLDEVEKTAEMTGTAIAIGHPHELTLELLEVWTRGLEAKGFDLVSISALASPDAQVEPGLLAASGL
jgi:uncharacterized protein